MTGVGNKVRPPATCIKNPEHTLGGGQKQPDSELAVGDVITWPHSLGCTGGKIYTLGWRGGAALRLVSPFVLSWITF